MAYARAQGPDTVYTGQSTLFVVETEQGNELSWELYNDVVGLNLAVVPGNCPPTDAYFIGGVTTGDSVEVMWLMPGTYFIKVTADDTCTNNIKFFKITVLESISYATLLEPDDICQGDTAWMTVEITGGIGPWDITVTDGNTSWIIEDIEESPHTFPLIPSPNIPGNYQIWVSSVTSGTGMINPEPSDPVTLVVLLRPVTSPIYRYDPTASK
jgi:hypothetical protein